MHSSLAPTKILMVRHGQTVWNAEQRYAGSSEVDLAPAAVPQIRALTKYLKNIPIDAIYSSPLQRCLTTVRETARNHHRRIIIREELRERNLGSWEGKAPNEIHLTHEGYHFPDSAYNGDFRIPDAEPLDHLEKRVRAVLHEVHRAHPGQTVLLATHAGIIWMVQARIVTNPPKHLVWPANASISEVVAEGRHFTLTKTKHLALA